MDLVLHCCETKVICGAVDMAPSHPAAGNLCRLDKAVLPGGLFRGRRIPWFNRYAPDDPFTTREQSRARPMNPTLVPTRAGAARPFLPHPPRVSLAGKHHRGLRRYPTAKAFFISWRGLADWKDSERPV